jgi:guanylate kinase
MTEASYKNQLPSDPPVRPLLIVLSGLSGAGKDAVLKRVKGSLSLEHVTTVTTRPRRANEKNNVDYHFVSAEKFQEMLKNEELLEWAEVYGNWYGVPMQPIKKAISQGRDTVVKVDVQGAATIKKILPQAVLIFLMPSSMDEFILRLKQRRTESPSDLTLRIKTAEEEIKQLPLFDYIVINKQDEMEQAVSDIKAIITAEKCRVDPRGTTP